MVTRTGGMGTARTDPSGRCLRPRCSWLVPLLVQAAAVRGAAWMRVRIPQPWRSAFADATAEPCGTSPVRVTHWAGANLCGAVVALVPFGPPAFYTAGMSEDTRPGEEEAQHEELPA